MSTKSRLISGRVPVSSSANVAADRYQFLDLSSAEPNLGTGNTGDVLVINNSYAGGRAWIPQEQIRGSVGEYAFVQANTASANTVYLTGVDVSQNTRLDSIETVNVQQNTKIQAAFDKANTAEGSVGFLAFDKANGAYNQANIATVLAQAAFDSGNTSVTLQLGINSTQNTNITAADTKAQGAFDKANTGLITTTSATAPTNPNVGDMWYHTNLDILFRYTYDNVSNNWVDITGPLTSDYIRNSYAVTPNTTSINETSGNTVIFTVTTTNHADGTVLYWTNSGTTVAADFSDGANTGLVTIANNTATITRSLVADTFTDGSETIIINLRTTSNTGTIVANSSTVTVGDTSQAPVSYSLSYLSVAGGGGGGSYDSTQNGLPGAGGGAGGYLTGTLLTPADGVSTYTITIGAGGTGRTSGAGSTNGANSSIANTSSLVTSIGGGRGAYDMRGDGGNGGSGGGACWLGAAGTGIAGQGNDGGTDNTSIFGGSGGGAGAVGGSNGAAGGAGLYSSITGISVARAGGGGGGRTSGSTSIAGGIGGGGAGCDMNLTRNGFAGTVNTGGGGGGGAAALGDLGGAGGSGVVILSYIGDNQKGSGGTVTTYTSGPDQYWVHTFTSSGTYTIYS